MDSATKLPADNKHAYVSVPDGASAPSYSPRDPAAEFDQDDEERDLDYEHDERDLEALDDFDMEEERNGFELSLFGCFKMPTFCLMGTFLSPCLFARANRMMVRKPSEDPALLQKQFGTLVNKTMFTYCCLEGVTHGLGTFCWRMVRRGNLRAKYRIRGHVARDCLVSFFCGPCAVAQEDYEVRKREQEKATMDFRYAQRDQVEDHLL